MKKIIEQIEKERKEQIEKHCYTLEFDKTINRFGQLLDAASNLLREDAWELPAPEFWDTKRWNKMASKNEKDRCIIAAALIVAHLELTENE